MQHEIINTTDGHFIGLRIDIATRPIVLKDTEFFPDRVVQISAGVIRLSNPNYIIDAKETNA